METVITCPRSTALFITRRNQGLVSEFECWSWDWGWCRMSLWKDMLLAISRRRFGSFWVVSVGDKTKNGDLRTRQNFNRPVPNYSNWYLAPRLRGIKQKKWITRPGIDLNAFFGLYRSALDPRMNFNKFETGTLSSVTGKVLGWSIKSKGLPGCFIIKIEDITWWPVRRYEFYVGMARTSVLGPGPHSRP